VTNSGQRLHFGNLDFYRIDEVVLDEVLLDEEGESVTIFCLHSLKESSATF